MSAGEHTQEPTEVTHIGKAFPEVSIDGVLVAVSLQVVYNTVLESLWGQEIPQHVQDTRSLER